MAFTNENINRVNIILKIIFDLYFFCESMLKNFSQHNKYKQLQMFSKFLYPKNYMSFMQFVKSSERFSDAFFRLGCPKAHDITLHDGLQSLPLEEQYHFDVASKSELLYFNNANFRPSGIDMGSMTSSKLLPVMRKNATFFKKSYADFRKFGLKHTPLYIQIFDTKQLDYLISHDIFHSLAVSSSLSEDFQKHNTKGSIEETKKELERIVFELDMNCYQREVITMPYPKLKLTLSCFNTCPLQQKAIEDSKIVDYMSSYYHSLKPDILSLKDTTGLLKPKDMERILQKCFDQGVRPERLSMHFHNLQKQPDKVTALINSALDMKIRTYEVSSINSGGCPFNKNNLLRNNIPTNLTYELFYKTLVDRILFDVKNVK